MAGTLAEKVWESHVVRRGEGEPDLLYIDLHLLHEVTSPQAFDGLRLSGRPVRRTDLTLATEDHNVPTTPGPITDPVSRTQVETLRRNCEEFGVTLYPMGDAEQGIVHVVGPQLGLTQPGMTIVCGDSHTSTHGAFGALAFGIGTSEVEHVLATQTLPLKPFRTMAITAKMMSLAVTPRGNWPSTLTAMVLNGRSGRVWVARTCSTSDVPIPIARAPNAPWVEVWLSPHTIVIPGWVRPSCGPMTCTMPCSASPIGYSRTPNSAQLRRNVSTWVREIGSAIGLSMSVVGTLWSSVAIVRSGRCTGRPANRSPSNAWGLVTSWMRCMSM